MLIYFRTNKLYKTCSQERVMVKELGAGMARKLRLLFIPADDPIPSKKDGGIDLARVTEIEIIEIEDTH